MAYKKHIWVPRTGTKLNRFLKYNETATSVELVNAPETVTQEGTPFSAQIMNEIEEELERSSQAQEQINGDNAAINAKQTAIENAINANASAISDEAKRAANAESALATAISTAESNAKNLANATGTLAVEKGGTGATTAAAARSKLGLGDVSTLNKSGKTFHFLRGDGTWQAAGLPGGRLRKANLCDIFGSTDPQKVIQYASAQKEAVAAGDYVDLAAFSFTDDVTGDTISVTKTGNNTRIRIAGNPSPYRNSGDSTNPDGIMWEFQNVPFSRAMDTNNVNTAAYQGSQIYTLLNGNFATALQSVLGSANTIKTTRRLEPTTNADDYGNWAWQGEKTFLLTETEVLGFKNVGAKKFQVGNMWQLPIYALDPSCRIKFYNGSRYWWWLSSAYTIDSNNGWNSSCFADVGNGGYAGWHGAGIVGGVSPAFII